ncbi:hypothetical protein KCU62_g230, partial [Aureobasidium sp. EXF-3399]
MTSVTPNLSWNFLQTSVAPESLISSQNPEVENLRPMASVIPDAMQPAASTPPTSTIVTQEPDSFEVKMTCLWKTSRTRGVDSQDRCFSIHVVSVMRLWSFWADCSDRCLCRRFEDDNLDTKFLLDSLTALLDSLAAPSILIYNKDFAVADLEAMLAHLTLLIPQIFANLEFAIDVCSSSDGSASDSSGACCSKRGTTFGGTVCPTASVLCTFTLGPRPADLSAVGRKYGAGKKVDLTSCCRRCYIALYERMRCPWPSVLQGQTSASH